MYTQYIHITYITCFHMQGKSYNTMATMVNHTNAFRLCASLHQCGIAFPHSQLGVWYHTPNFLMHPPTTWLSVSSRILTCEKSTQHLLNRWQTLCHSY